MGWSPRRRINGTQSLSSINSSSRTSSHFTERRRLFNSCSRARRGYIAWGQPIFLLPCLFSSKPYFSTEWRTGLHGYSAKPIQAGYTTLDSISRIKKGSGTRFYCPALKELNSSTQAKVSNWIQLLHKHPAHLHALDIKDAQQQRDPGIKPLAGWQCRNSQTNIP